MRGKEYARYCKLMQYLAKQLQENELRVGRLQKRAKGLNINREAVAVAETEGDSKAIKRVIKYLQSKRYLE